MSSDTQHRPDGGFNMGRFEPWFQRHFTTTWKRLTAKIVIVVLVCGLAGAAYGLITSRAMGAEPARNFAQRCVGPDGDERACPAQFAVTKFKHGKMGKVHGVKASRVWKHPAAARKVWIRKIDRKLSRSRPAFARGMSAAQLYRQAMSTASCVGHGSYSPYSYGFDVCTIQGPETRITTEDIQKTGAVIFCGGGVVIGAVTSEVGGWVIAFGAASCAWSAWMSMSD